MMTSLAADVRHRQSASDCAAVVLREACWPLEAALDVYRERIAAGKGIGDRCSESSGATDTAAGAFTARPAALKLKAER